MSLLKAIAITKSYSGVQALKGASFELRAGEVHALVGENGAGKSTRIKIMTGAIPADSGRIEVNGRAVVDNTPVLAKSLGIAAIYQQPAVALINSDDLLSSTTRFNLLLPYNYAILRRKDRGPQ